VELVARKYHDIEVAHDEARRLQREENLLHVQNQVLDNCLSTIKHETIYYPNKIRQIVEKLNQGKYEGEERSQVETMAELVAYYKDVFTLLSSCASRQLEEVTFRRNEVKAVELANHAAHYLKKQARKMGFDIDWQVEVEDVSLNGDSIQLNYLLENLIDEALTHTGNGRLELKARKDGNFVRFDFIDRRRTLTQEELDLLFYPHLSKINRKDEEVLAGTEYLICKQIIREHDEYAGRRGCRINAEQADGGGFRVWFTIPIR
jgi:K+-sensing histidine kinase KdpD